MKAIESLYHGFIGQNGDDKDEIRRLQDGTLPLSIRDEIRDMRQELDGHVCDDFELYIKASLGETAFRGLLIKDVEAGGGTTDFPTASEAEQDVYNALVGAKKHIEATKEILGSYFVKSVEHAREHRKSGRVWRDEQDPNELYKLAKENISCGYYFADGDKLYVKFSSSNLDEKQASQLVYAQRDFVIGFGKLYTGVLKTGNQREIDKLQPCFEYVKDLMYSSQSVFMHPSISPERIREMIDSETNCIYKTEARATVRFQDVELVFRQKGGQGFFAREARHKEQFGEPTKGKYSSSGVEVTETQGLAQNRQA